MNDEQDGTPPSTPTRVSVVVPCAGDLRDIGPLVESLAAQEAAFTWEAVFVDNNLPAAARARLEIALERSPPPRHRLVSEGAPGASPARNTGVAAADGEVLAFIDADDVASPTWLEALAGTVEPGTIAAGHLELAELNPAWLVRTRGAPRDASYLCEGIFPVAPSGNMAITRQDFDRLGGFDAGWGTLEDFELSFRAWKVGVGVRPAGRTATVHYRLRHDPWSLYRQGRRYGTARARMFRRLADEGLVKPTSLAGWKSWLLLGVTALQAPFGAPHRATAMWILGNRLGRLAGSVRHRVVYL